LASANTGESKTSAQASPGSIPCFTTSLDALVLRAPAGVDVLKVDVEGAEYDIFHAFTLWSRVGKYHIEYHDVEPWREEALRRYGLWDDELGPIPPLQKLIHGKLGLTYWTRHTRML